MTGGRWRAALAGLAFAGLILAPGAAQDVFNGRSTGGPPAPEQYNGGDLHQYLSPDGRFFDRCRYWHDHPDFNTQYYGWPDHFAAGQPIGNTNSYNGQPAPYASCAVDPCNRGGVICWRNKPSAPASPNAQMQAVLRAQGCTVDGNGAITCPSRIPGHGNRCHVTLNGGIACNTSEEPPATQSGASNPPCAQFSPPQQGALRKTGIEALDMAAGAGQQADHMLQVFGYAVASGIAELRDAQAFTQQQKANVAAVLKLLSLPNAQFHQVLNGGVSAQVQDLERDPSGYLGGAAAAYFFSRGVSGAGVCMAAAGGKTVDAVNKAARRLRQIANRFPRARDPLKRGMPLADDTALRNLAKSRRWIIVVRDSNPAAMKWIGDPRALPKPMELKAKSIPYDPAKPMSAQPNAGLATAKGLPDADVAKLKAAGYSVDWSNDGVLSKGGKYFYSDTDLNGVYDAAGGASAWPQLESAAEARLIGNINDKFVDNMVQHGPHDQWPLRNSAAAGPNYGPQVGGGKSLTAYLPDGSAVNLGDVTQMRAFYESHGIDFSTIYPGFAR